MLHKSISLHYETKSLYQEIKVTETYKYGFTRLVGYSACPNKYGEDPLKLLAVEDKIIEPLIHVTMT